MNPQLFGWGLVACCFFGTAAWVLTGGNLSMGIGTYAATMGLFCAFVVVATMARETGGDE